MLLGLIPGRNEQDENVAQHIIDRPEVDAPRRNTHDHSHVCYLIAEAVGQGDPFPDTGAHAPFAPENALQASLVGFEDVVLLERAQELPNG